MIDPQAAAVLRDMQAQAKPMPSDQAEWLRGYGAQLDTLPRLQGPAPDIDVAAANCPGPAIVAVLCPASRGRPRNRVRRSRLRLRSRRYGVGL